MTRTILVKPIGEDLVEDARILRFHVTSSLNRNPILQLLFDISKEPAGVGNCVLITIFARFGSRSALMFFHLPVGDCRTPPYATWPWVDSGWQDSESNDAFNKVNNDG